ncbi:MAG: GHMP kinase [Acidobacteria bacterium]|nr:GHMP kinase [Acidobacteriota bacterium]
MIGRGDGAAGTASGWRELFACDAKNHRNMTLHSQAPARVDLAGGTLDIWPLYLFHPGAQTINFAINCYARCRVTARRDKVFELISRDLRRRESFPSFQALQKAKRFRLPLLARLLIAFEPPTGLTIEMDSDAPAGSGLGGSSALNIAICGALNRFLARRMPPTKLIELARNVEAQVIGIPTGEQDYYSAMYGGLQAIHLTPRGVQAEKLPMGAHELNDRFVLCYTGQSRASALNNWEVFKAHVDGKRGVIRHFDRIAAIAAAMREALLEKDWKQVATLLDQDWQARKKNYPGITTATIERLMATARRHGALAAKACGAGGGGCVVFLVEPEAKLKVEEALRRTGVRLLLFHVEHRGLRVQAADSSSE